jgi:hypothetical protein
MRAPIIFQSAMRGRMVASACGAATGGRMLAFVAWSWWALRPLEQPPAVPTVPCREPARVALG